MAAYVIIDSKLTDEALFGDFSERVATSADANGGKYLVRGGATEPAAFAPPSLVSTPPNRSLPSGSNSGN